jgi:hypothetical protein
MSDPVMTAFLKKRPPDFTRTNEPATDAYSSAFEKRPRRSE